LPSDSAYAHAVESFRQANYPLEQIPAEMKKAYKDISDKDIKLAIQSTEKGNLYKVDIPDENIPNMLDWDKPLNQQPKNVQEAFSKFDSIAAKDPERGTMYMQRWFRSPSTAKELESMGYKGFKYLDEGSRHATGGEIIDTFKTPDGWKSKIRVNNGEMDINGKPINSFTISMPFKTAEEAKTWANEKISGGTSNFVVFDPSTVKILEKNNNPIEGLLD
jgi:hypothetical protein